MVTFLAIWPNNVLGDIRFTVPHVNKFYSCCIFRYLLLKSSTLITILAKEYSIQKPRINIVLYLRGNTATGLYNFCLKTLETISWRPEAYCPGKKKLRLISSHFGFVMNVINKSERSYFLVAKSVLSCVRSCIYLRLPVKEEGKITSLPKFSVVFIPIYCNLKGVCNFQFWVNFD